MSLDTPTRFYTAFAALDHHTMNACYAPEATFKDPVFELHGQPEIAAMWTALVKGAADCVVTFAVGTVTDTHADATWEAKYTFGPTGRSVHNKITTSMELRDGLIVAHRDSFSFHAWARQALGLPGLLLGWAPPFQAKVAATARKGLRL